MSLNEADTLTAVPIVARRSAFQTLRSFTKAPDTGTHVGGRLLSVLVN